jgi:hypothetical protein
MNRHDVAGPAAFIATACSGLQWTRIRAVRADAHVAVRRPSHKYSKAFVRRYRPQRQRGAPPFYPGRYIPGSGHIASVPPVVNTKA